MPFGVGHPFKNPRISAPFGQNDEDCAGVGFTLLQHAAKPALGRDPADQGINLEVSGQARFQASQPMTGGV